MNAPERAAYHHGNLKDALIVAVAEMIEETGTLEFSIADAARRAGVTNAAPYRHFKDKEDLLAHVRDLAFMGLYEFVKDAIAAEAAKGDTKRTVVAIGKAYLRYMRENAVFFPLMWADRGDVELSIEEIEGKMSGFNILLDAVIDFCVECNHPEGRDALHPAPINVATQLWALAHGIATLEANHMLSMFDRAATPERLLEESTLALLSGLDLHRPGRAQATEHQQDPQGSVLP